MFSIISNVSGTLNGQRHRSEGGRKSSERSNRSWVSRDDDADAGDDGDVDVDVHADAEVLKGSKSPTFPSKGWCDAIFMKLVLSGSYDDRYL